MRRSSPTGLLTALIALLAAGPGLAQEFGHSAGPHATSAVVPTAQAQASHAGYTEWAGGHGGQCGCQHCGGTPGCGEYNLSDPDEVFFVGADYLFIRPHFSEAIAFAQGRQTLTSFSTRTRELDFDYDSNFRVFAGFRTGSTGDELRFTYTHIEGDTDVDGAVTTPGDFIVDPFGNLVGGLVVIDPTSALFGQTLLGGDAIQTRAEVELDVYDLEYIRPFRLPAPCWYMSWSAGVRVADIEQYYESIVTAGGLPIAQGDFSAEFVGAGPRLGLEGRRYFSDGDFALFARGYGSLLLGQYDVDSGNTMNVPVAFTASQSSSMTRLIPVAEAEVGGMWQPSDRLKLSAGWLFQSWFDLGTSGGTFGGFFAGADDGNTMSFDGLFLRAEVGF